MKRHNVLILGIVIFMILLVPMALNAVQALSSNPGPIPIPGDLIPFPGHPHGPKHIHVFPHLVPPSSK